MVEKIDDDSPGRGDRKCEGISDEVLGKMLGVGNVGFDPYQVVYPQEQLWVLDMRFVSNDPGALRGLRGHVRTVGKAYFKHGPGGRFLRLTAWGGIEEFIH